MINGVRKQTKVRMPLKLTSVYVVPGITSNLFSCKHGFEFNHIGTELNDRLCLTPPSSLKLFGGAGPPGGPGLDTCGLAEWAWGGFGLKKAGLQHRNFFVL